MEVKKIIGINRSLEVPLTPEIILERIQPGRYLRIKTSDPLLGYIAQGSLFGNVGYTFVIAEDIGNITLVSLPHENDSLKNIPNTIEYRHEETSLGIFAIDVETQLEAMLSGRVIEHLHFSEEMYSALFKVISPFKLGVMVTRPGKSLSKLTPSTILLRNEKFKDYNVLKIHHKFTPGRRFCVDDFTVEKPTVVILPLSNAREMKDIYLIPPELKKLGFTIYKNIVIEDYTEEVEIEGRAVAYIQFIHKNLVLVHCCFEPFLNQNAYKAEEFITSLEERASKYLCPAEETTEDYPKRIVKRILENRLNALEGLKEAYTSSISTLLSNLKKENVRLKEVETTIRIVKESSSKAEESLNRAIASITKHKLCDKFYISKNCDPSYSYVDSGLFDQALHSASEFKLFTKMIFIKSSLTGLTHAIGRFLITWGLDVDIKFINLSWRRDSLWEGSNAPHVNSRGSACFGDIATEMNKSLAQCDIESIAYTALAYINSVNEEDSAGRLIYAFPVIAGNEIIRNYMTEETESKFRDYYDDNKKCPEHEEIKSMILSGLGQGVDNPLNTIPYIPEE